MEEKKMSLYEYMNEYQEDVDTYDTEHDAVVTVCFMEEEDAEDNYDRFCLDIIKKVEVESFAHGDVVVDWSGFVKKNMEQLKAFAKKYWNNQYEDDEDEFIYQWIREIHYYLAGYVGESTYKALNQMLATLE